MRDLGLLPTIPLHHACRRLNIFNVQRHVTSAQTHHELRAVAMDIWRTGGAEASQADHEEIRDSPQHRHRWASGIFGGDERDRCRCRAAGGGRSANNRVGNSHQPFRRRERAVFMTEPTEDKILVKAKQLAHDDGKLWDFEPSTRRRIRTNASPTILSGLNI